jgi:uncharacterized phage protein (TIGR01671 family)
MREIKFRGKGLENGIWVYGSLILSKLYADGKRNAWIREESYLPLGGISTPTVDFIQVDPKTIGQFTGYRDKNKKDIYADDIMRLVYIHDAGRGWRSKSNEIGKVYFDANWGVKFDCRDFSQRIGNIHWKLTKSSFQDATDVVIIGNIHENPELLKPKE